MKLNYTKEEIEHRRDGVHHSWAAKQVCEDWLELNARNVKLVVKVAALSVRNDKLVEAVAAVVTCWKEDFLLDAAQGEIGELIENLRLTAKLKAPPADETHDPDPDGDRRPENDR